MLPRACLRKPIAPCAVAHGWPWAGQYRASPPNALGRRCHKATSSPRTRHSPKAPGVQLQRSPQHCQNKRSLRGAGSAVHSDEGMRLFAVPQPKGATSTRPTPPRQGSRGLAEMNRPCVNAIPCGLPEPIRPPAVGKSSPDGACSALDARRSGHKVKDGTRTQEPESA